MRQAPPPIPAIGQSRTILTVKTIQTSSFFPVSAKFTVLQRPPGHEWIMRKFQK